MKALFTLFISLSAFAVSAQKFMLGVQGGVILNTAPIGSAQYFTNFESAPKMVVGGKLGIDTRKIQVGVGCQVSSIEYARDLNFQGSAANEFTSYSYTASFVNPYLFLNLKKNLLRSFLYAGINVGYLNFTSGKDEAWNMGDPQLADLVYSTSGFSGGLHAGARIKLIDGLGISAEAGLRYLGTIPAMELHDENSLNTGYVTGGTVSFPLTLGVDYIF